MKEVLNIRETAEMTGYSVPSLYRLTRQGRIPFHKPAQGKLIFHRAEISAWMHQ